MTQMKKMMLISAVMLISAAALAGKPDNPVKVVSMKNDVVYLKVSCGMIGAAINIYDAKGNMIHTTRVTDKKVIVDFYAEPSGSYTIHVVKDGNDKEITYEKETVSHAERAAVSYITVTQM
jgi:hypothetical protein